MYLSTSDYVQHKHPPGDAEANRFYGAVDRTLAEIDRLGATLVITADHGMRAKTDAAGGLRAVFLQDLLDGWLGAGAARVVLPITDPYVLHHGALGSCAMVYLTAPGAAAALAARVQATPGIDVAVPRDEACSRFDLPPDRTGDLVVFSNEATVIGTRPADHDLSALDAPLRSHGGRGEQEVPMLANRKVAGGEPSAAQLRRVRCRAEWVRVDARLKPSRSCSVTATVRDEIAAAGGDVGASVLQLHLQLVPARLADAARRVGQQIARPHLVERLGEEILQLPIRCRRPAAPAGDLGQLVEKRVRLHPDRRE